MAASQVQHHQCILIAQCRQLRLEAVEQYFVAAVFPLTERHAGAGLKGPGWHPGTDALATTVVFQPAYGDPGVLNHVEQIVLGLRHSGVVIRAVES